MTTQKQIEQLRADIKTCEEAIKIATAMNSGKMVAYLDAIKIKKAKLAALEAQAAAEADLWKIAKATVSDWEQVIHHVSNEVSHLIRYVRHLEAETKRLETELAKRPVVLYAGNRAYTYETCTGQKS